MRTTHEAYIEAEEIDKAISKTLGKIRGSENVTSLRNALLFCRTVRTSIDLYEVELNKSLSKLLLA